MSWPRLGRGSHRLWLRPVAYAVLQFQRACHGAVRRQGLTAVHRTKIHLDCGQSHVRLQRADADHQKAQQDGDPADVPFAKFWLRPLHALGFRPWQRPASLAKRPCCEKHSCVGIAHRIGKPSQYRAQRVADP